MWIGDLVINFGQSSPRSTARHDASPWRQQSSFNNAQLWTQEPSDSWTGFPCQTGETCGWTYWFLGEIYDRGPGNTDDRTCIERLLMGKAGPDGINGNFILFAWHQEDREWHVWTDRFGTIHAYHSASESKAALGSFFPTVASIASQKKLDWVGLLSLVNCGFFLKDLTHYTDTKILLPASHYRFDQNGILLNRESYWTWAHEPNTTRGFDETVSEFGERFHETIESLVRDSRIAIPISGGLDSRSLVAAIQNLKPKLGDSSPEVWGYSYGYSPKSVETAISGQIAQAAELPFQSYSIEPYLMADVKKALTACEGFIDVTLPRQIYVADALRANADYVLGGHWGDVWLGDMGFVDRQESATLDDLVDHTMPRMVKHGGAWLVQALDFEKKLGEKPPAVLREMIRAGLAEFDHIEDPDFRIKAFKTSNWSFRWTVGGIRAYQTGAFPRLPFYDNRMTDFFATTPSSYVARRRLQIEYLKRFAPSLAKITWQDYDANLYNYQYFNTLLLPKRILNKIKRLISRESPQLRNWEVQFLNPQGREQLNHWLLRSELRLHDLVPKLKVKELVDSLFDEPLRQRGYAVSSLLSISLWLEHFG